MPQKATKKHHNRHPIPFFNLCLQTCLILALVSTGCGKVLEYARTHPEIRVDFRKLPVRGKWFQEINFSTLVYYYPQESAQPAIQENMLLVGSNRNRFYGIDAETGAVRWEFTTKGPVESTPLIVGDKVYFGDSEGTFYSLNIKDGFYNWSISQAAPILCRPTLGDGKIFITTASNEVHAIDPQAGRWLWQAGREAPYALSLKGLASPVFSDGLVFCGFSDGSVVAYAAASGEVVWSKDLVPKGKFMDVDATPLIDGDSLFIGTYDGYIYALKKSSGEFLWKYKNDAILSSLTSSAERIYATTVSGKILALDKKNHTLAWEVDTRHRQDPIWGDTVKYSGGVPTAPVLTGNYLIVANSDNDLAMLDQQSGQLVWQKNIGSIIRSVPLARDHEIWVVSGGGCLYKFIF
jgi:outer membrane protein assembly factor BamB